MRDNTRFGIIPGVIVLLVLVYIVIVIHSALVTDTSDDGNDSKEDDNSTVSTPSYNNISLSKSFNILGNHNRTYPTIRIVNVISNDSEAKSFLKRYGYWDTSIDTDYSYNLDNIQIRNENYTIFLSYNGYFEYDYLNDDYSPVNKSVIQKKSDHLSKGEAESLARKYLTDKGIINASWYLTNNLTKYRSYLINDTTVVLNYFFQYVPVIDNLPVFDPEAPFVIIRVNPVGDVINCIINVKEVRVDINEKKTSVPNPYLVLVDIDDNIANYSIGKNTSFVTMELCYRRMSFTGNVLYPTWRMTYGDNNRTYLYTSDKLLE